jgi:hypothetical protein
MAENTLLLCPNCEKGRMRPAGKAEFFGENENHLER